MYLPFIEMYRPISILSFIERSAGTLSLKTRNETSTKIFKILKGTCITKTPMVFHSLPILETERFVIGFVVRGKLKGRQYAWYYTILITYVLFSHVSILRPLDGAGCFVLVTCWSSGLGPLSIDPMVGPFRKAFRANTCSISVLSPIVRYEICSSSG